MSCLPHRESVFVADMGKNGIVPTWLVAYRAKSRPISSIRDDDVTSLISHDAQADWASLRHELWVMEMKPKLAVSRL